MQNRPGIHVCPVYDSLTPIITPALDPSFRPSGVVLLSSPHLADKTEDLVAALTALGVRVKKVELLDEWGGGNLEAILDDILLTCNQCDVMLNVSSGTTPLCIMASRYFIDKDLPVYYVNPENDRVVWIHPSTRPGFELKERLDLEHYFIAHGIDRISSAPELKPDSNLLAAAHEIVSLSSSMPKAIAQLNFLGTKADGKTFSVPYSTATTNTKNLSRLINVFTKHGLAHTENGRLFFSSLEAKSFASGGWLEVYTHGEVERLRRTNPAIRDVKRGAFIRKIRDNEEVTNEIDLAILADNRFYMIECKTGGDTLNMPDVIYKLDAVRSFLDDERAGAMIISVKSATSSVRKRAAEHNVHLCTGAELNNLYEIMASRIAKGHD